MASGDARISPTAHYTSYVWYRAGLSDETFATRAGALLHKLLAPLNAGATVVGAPLLDDLLLSRHHAIDHLLSKAIESGEVGQVLEIGAGLSPRGREFSSRFSERGLIYVEGDLPRMARRKLEILKRAKARPGDHRVVGLDARSADDLRDVCERHFVPSKGAAIITEGLLEYFDTGNMLGMWKNFADLISRFPYGLYLSDLHIKSDIRAIRLGRAFILLLTAFTRGKVYLHFEDAAEVEQALLSSGFPRAILRDAADVCGEIGFGAPRNMVRIVEARY